MADSDKTMRQSKGRSLGDRLTLYAYGLMAILGLVVGFAELTEDVGYGLILIVVIGATLGSCANAIREDLRRDIRALSHRSRRRRRA